MHPTGRFDEGTNLMDLTCFLQGGLDEGTNLMDLMCFLQGGLHNDTNLMDLQPACKWNHQHLHFIFAAGRGHIF